MEPVHIAIFASGSGSNAENIATYFKTNKNYLIKLILTNKSDAFVLERAKKLNIEAIVFDKNDFYKSEKILEMLKARKISWIILAGFLWLLPENLIQNYPDRIINIHPALLPKYGGKGMYGMNVHEAVIKNKEKESGITIHFVNKEYDKGDIIFQAKCKVNEDDNAETLAQKIHQLEYLHFPEVIEKLIQENK